MRFVSRLLPPANRRTICPPGKLRPGTAPLIVVVSIRRSGTHLLIDAILNNFAVYKRRPLYVSLDQYLLSGYPVEDLLACGGYIVTTHFPQTLSFDYESQVRAVVQQATVLVPSRPIEQTYRAEVAFTGPISEDEFVE